jgi:Zn-finger nucleic acid-binding protein
MVTRNCVRCGQVFRATSVGDVEVDLCRGCGGLWLDHQELQQLAEMSDDELDGLRKLIRSGEKKAAPAVRAEPLRIDAPCPSCAGKLTHAMVGGVTLEVCSRCAGVFLDAGELDNATAEVRGRQEKLATIAAMARSVTTSGTIGG